jgi:hypothetical protein
MTFQILIVVASIVNGHPHLTATLGKPLQLYLKECRAIADDLKAGEKASIKPPRAGTVYALCVPVVKP